LGPSGSGRERERGWIESARDATIAANDQVKGKGRKARTMDVWCAVFKRK